jgi:hypothetical protein
MVVEVQVRSSAFNLALGTLIQSLGHTMEIYYAQKQANSYYFSPISHHNTQIFSLICQRVELFSVCTSRFLAKP